MRKIIPIGMDCSIATLLTKHNFRFEAYPFDWNLTYKGVSEIVDNQFNNFYDNDGILFYHHTFPQDYEKYKRRIARFNNILKSSNDEIIFIRKGHYTYHHVENNKTSNDLEDCERLDVVLKNKYPHLNYTIIVILLCDGCFDPKANYATTSSNIKIHNVATSGKNEYKVEEILLNLIR